nr:ribonuclease H-like domain-containing protein [Tanacetum cinerariifolium]
RNVVESLVIHVSVMKVDCDDDLSSESDETWPPSSLYDRFQPSDGYHALSLTKPEQDLSHTNRPTAPIIEDWVSDSEDEFETKAPQVVPSFAQSTDQVESPRHSVQHVETSIPAATLKPASPKPAVLPQSKPISVTAVRPVSIVVPKIKGNPQHALKDKGVIDSGCSRHMTGNMSYLYGFEELNCGYVAFGGNPKGGKISRKRKIKTEKLDFDDVYFVKELKFNLFSVSQMCDKKYSALFTDTECLVLSPDFKMPDESQVLLRVPREQYNNDGYAAFVEKEPEFDAKKPESEVIVSPSSSAQSKKQDDKTKREAKGKSPVESLTGYRDLSAEFEDYSNNSINEVHDAGTLVLTVGQISPNSTNTFSAAGNTFSTAGNTFSAAGPSNTTASPTRRKSSFIDAYQLLDDPDMPELEDITYSNDEDDVGVEADFNNLETSVTVSLIPTTRGHKYHPVTQIIGDLSSVTQTRSMTRVAKDQGGLSQMFSDDFHTCMFACFLSQKEPKRAHQALKDPSLIESMQEELL